MPRSTMGAVFGLAALGVVQLPVPAQAQNDIPFTITAPPVSGYHISCAGPARDSGCAPFGPDAENGRVFYQADDNFITPLGAWKCKIYSSSNCASRTDVATESFCLYDRSRLYVDLTFDGSTDLSVNHPYYCPNTRASSVLGQTSEADATPAQDVDTYRFAGRAGEAVEIKLGRDGSYGSLGEVATLRLRAQGGDVVAERTGAVPLALKVTLPGPVEIEVLRDLASGKALRGGYEVELVFASGSDGRVLRPNDNVE